MLKEGEGEDVLYVKNGLNIFLKREIMHYDIF